MAPKKEKELLQGLRGIDTPSITNVVATYPSNETCLGLYNPWTGNWYTDTSVRCIYPELGRTVGYAVTCVFSLPDPNFKRLSFMDVADALDASKRPSILVIEQKFPPELADKVGLAGGIMTTVVKTLGCVGVISKRSIARHRRDTPHEDPVPARRRYPRAWRYGGAGGERSRFSGRHGRRPGRHDSHGRERRLQIPRRQGRGCTRERQQAAGR